MRAFFELKKNKILHTTFTTYKPYSVTLITSSTLIAKSEPLYLYGSGTQVTGRSFFNSSLQYMTAAADFSGSIYFGNRLSSDTNVYLSSTQGRAAIFRMNAIYASSSFLKPQNYEWVNNVNAISELQIPSVFYGSEIKPGSFHLNIDDGVDVYDDGYGGIYFGSTLVGSIYYQHGVVILSEIYSEQNFTVYFSGTHKTPMNMYIIDVPKGEANFSTNESYTNYDTGSGDFKLAINKPKTYPSAVGLYDENYDLVGVVKLATPFLHDELTSGQIRAKLVF